MFSTHRCGLTLLSETQRDQQTLQKEKSVMPVLRDDSFDLPFVFLVHHTTNSSTADTATAIVQPITTTTISSVFAVIPTGSSGKVQCIWAKLL